MFDYYDDYDCEVQCEEYYDDDEYDYDYETHWYDKYCYQVVEHF